MRLKKFLLRYYPPGLGLEYLQKGENKRKLINLLHLNVNTDIMYLCKTMMDNEQLITESVKPQLLSALAKLQKKLFDDVNYFYEYQHTLHESSITQVALNKDGSKCISGSYDKTCKVWDTKAGAALLTLPHTGIVYGVSFNSPYETHTFSDRILTASFDRTACIWNAETGQRMLTLCGHKDEVLSVKFDSIDKLVGTVSMDFTARIFHFDSGIELWSIKEHNDTIISLQFSNDGNTVLTGSFDSNIYLWDKRTHQRVVSFQHQEEISNCVMNFDCTLVGSGSVDKTARVWDLRNQKCLCTLHHDDEVIHVDFDRTGRKFATACIDGFAKVFDLVSHNARLISTLVGHNKELSTVSFSPGGSLVLTASSDKTARFWKWDSGECVQVLTGHKDEIFDCAMSYDGSILVTASKDCTCQIYRHASNEKYETMFKTKN